MRYRNIEGYPDPTAGAAMANMTREETFMRKTRVRTMTVKETQCSYGKWIAAWPRATCCQQTNTDGKYERHSKKVAAHDGC